MLSIRVTSLPIHGQIFDHAEVSTQYDFIFECDITFQFVKEDFPLGILGAYKFVFLCFHSNRYYTVCFMWVLKFHFKVFGSLQSIATLLLVLSSDEQTRDLSGLFSKEQRLHQYYAFPKEYNIKFQVAKSLENPFSFVVVLKTSNI